MKTARLLAALTGLLAILAISAAPASANFQANQPNTTQGPYQLKAATSAVFTSEAGGIPVECTELKGTWHEQTKFTKVEVVNGITKVKQDPTKDGAHQAISGVFNNCTANIGIKVEAKVNGSASQEAGCEIQVQQNGTGFLGAVKRLCIIGIPAGNVQFNIIAGNPNTGLSEVKSVNIAGGSKEDISEIKGITSVEKGTTVKSTGTFKATGIAHSQKVE